MKSRVCWFFDRFLSEMEMAHQALTKREFRELEEKIKAEIAYHRRRKKDKAA